MAVIVIWVFFALLVAFFADSTTLGFAAAFILSLLLSPLIGFVIALCYPDKKVAAQRLKNSQQSGLSSADELAKYSKLKDDGIVTEEEFAIIKKNLIK